MLKLNYPIVFDFSRAASMHFEAAKVVLRVEFPARMLFGSPWAPR